MRDKSIAPFESSSGTIEEDAKSSRKKNIDWTGKAEDCCSQGLVWGIRYEKKNKASMNVQ